MPTATTESSQTVLDLAGDRTPIRALVRDIVRRRHLLPMLASRDFRARYRSSKLGITWAILLPLFQGTILAIVFSHLVRIQTTTNYAAFVMVGMMTWTYLTSSVSLSATSITDQSDIASRVYFPRIFLSGMAVLANAPALFIGLVLVIPIAAILGVNPTWHLVTLPLAVLLSLLVGYAFGAPLALLNVYFRDVRYLIIAALQALLYLSPVIYPMTRLHHHMNLLAINPATGPIELARWSFNANNNDPLLVPILGSLVWIVGLAVVTAVSYSKHERLACDRL
ncbi:MAG TPA: ABC transporter permease [Mycobacteriales bacterium]|nr:ABC transporter permease [Mycobacteriales bacterium]